MTARHDIRDCPCAMCARQRRQRQQLDAAERAKLRRCGIEIPAARDDVRDQITAGRAAAPTAARGGTHAGGGRPHRRTR